MVHEIAVHLKEDVIAAEIEVSRVFHPLGDGFAYAVERIGIVDVSFLNLELSTITHDVAPNEGVVDDKFDIVDFIRFGGVDMIGDFCPLSSIFHRVGYLGMEIAYVVNVTHHLIGRIVGICRVILDGFPAEFLIQPFPGLAVGFLLRFVINPIGYFGLEGFFIRLEGDVVRQSRLDDFGLFFVFKDNLVALNQTLAFGNETVDAARRHENGHEHSDENMKPFA